MYEEEGEVFVSAEIPPVDITERPCFKTARGRMQGSYLGIPSAQHALRRYLDPLVEAGAIRLSLPDKPRSSKQTYQAAEGWQGGGQIHPGA